MLVETKAPPAIKVEPHYSELDQPYLARLAEIDVAPIFILGLHRSGTTLLYQLLAETGAFNYVQYYHVNRYDEILHNHFTAQTAQAHAQLTQTIADLGLHSRAIDAISVSPTLPEEYGFVLKRHKSLLYRPYLRRSNYAQFMELCRKVQLTHQPALPILLKNPWDFGNLRYLARTFPTAKFVFIHRAPLVNLNSKLKAVRRTMQSRNAYSALVDRSYARMFDTPLRTRLGQALFPQRFSLDLWTLALDSQRGYAHYLRVQPQLKVPHIEIRYEDLCANPTQTLARLKSFLAVPANAQSTEMGTQIAPRPVRFLPALTKHRQRLQNLFAAYSKQLGYNVDGTTVRTEFEPELRS